MTDATDRSPASPGEQVSYPSGITSVANWRFDHGSFRITGQDFRPGGGEYEYTATIHRTHLPSLAAALGTDVRGIESAWSRQFAEINSSGFVSWLKAHEIEHEFFAWHDSDWF